MPDTTNRMALRDRVAGMRLENFLSRRGAWLIPAIALLRKPGAPVSGRAINIPVLCSVRQTVTHTPVGSDETDSAIDNPGPGQFQPALC
jgi:hypothetical protein